MLRKKAEEEIDKNLTFLHKKIACEVTKNLQLRLTGKIIYQSLYH
jgi:hypothetical protein